MAAALVASLLAATGARAQEAPPAAPASGHVHPAAPGGQGAPGGEAPCCAKMGEPGKPGMSAKAGMMTRAGGSSTAGAADDRLDRLLQTMNSTTGAEKTEAMAALLNVLVEQHRAMAAGEKGTGAPVMPSALAPALPPAAASGSSPKP